MTGFLFFYFSTKAAGVNSGRNSPALNESPDKDKKIEAIAILNPFEK